MEVSTQDNGKEMWDVVLEELFKVMDPSMKENGKTMFMMDKEEK